VQAQVGDGRGAVGEHPGDIIEEDIGHARTTTRPVPVHGRPPVRPDRYQPWGPAGPGTAATRAPVPVSAASSSSQVSRRRTTLATPPATTISAGRGWPLSLLAMVIPLVPGWRRG